MAISRPLKPKTKEAIKNRHLSLPEKAQALREGVRVLHTEAKAILHLAEQLDETFVQACERLLSCQGRVIVMGMGKSGQIGKKIAATLASTGTPAYFVHPAEASHGDFGMVTEQDVVLFLSSSGETEEMIALLPLFKRLGIPSIAITNASNSTLARFADIHLAISVTEEACSLGLAPTTSTTTTLALGDALAVALINLRGFSAEDFAFSHPGGQLGRRLLLKVSDLMHRENQIPRVYPEQNLAAALLEMTRTRLGMTAIVPENQPTHLVGIFTDGDLRRAFQKGLDIHHTQMSSLMITHFRTIQENQLASAALQLMETQRITALPVLNEQQELIGVLNLHDLMKAKVL